MGKSINITHRNMDSNIIQNEFTCFICKTYCIDPVTIGCGHSFCLPCFCISWEEVPHPPRCPACREISPQVNFKTNIVLKPWAVLARWARHYPLPSWAEQICEVHVQTKNFFCELIQDLLCVLCRKSKEHMGHRHCSTDWVAEEYWQRLLEQVRCMWKKTQEKSKKSKQRDQQNQNVGG